MTTTFETLYDLSVRLLTAAPGSQLGRLTLHHCANTVEAEALVTRAVLTRELPGEAPTSRWGILRVFMRNLVNRSFAPMSADAMLRCLDQVSSSASDESSRIAALMAAVASQPKLRLSLGSALDPARAPDGAGDCLDWLSARIQEYRTMPVRDIDADRLLLQLRLIAIDEKTKVPHIGIALAANLFADLGIRVVAKPDLHVLEVMQGLRGETSLTEEACIRDVIRLAQLEAPSIASNERFAWLTGGLYPRDLDRLIYLIGSDNFRLDGKQLQARAPARRALIAEALRGAATTTGSGPAAHIPQRRTTRPGSESSTQTKDRSMKTEKPWTDVTLESLQHAMAACQAIDAPAEERLRQFRQQQNPGFHAARGVRMRYGDLGPFEARPLIAAAYAHQFGVAPLAPRDFNGNDAHDFLKRLGFDLVEIEP